MIETNTLIETLNLGIKKNKSDAVCFKIPTGASVSLITTKNKYAAAPVLLSRENIKKKTPRYLLVNSGNANACTGKKGVENAKECISYISKKLNCKKEEVLLFSTGIIGQQLPIKKISASINSHDFKFKSSWKSAAKSIMTTDKFHKYINKNIVIKGIKINIQAICKGAGMIEPNMATMLSFINIETKLSKRVLTKILKKSAKYSFNRISVDGDMSTNDCVLMIASGEKSKINFESDIDAYNMLEKEIIIICQDLSRMIIKDGEGATKVIEIEILKAANLTQAKKVAYTIANSNLIKTAMYGSNPNWGRIVAKLGSIDSIKYSPNKIVFKINGYKVFEKGIQPRRFNITKLNKSMKNKEISIEIDLNNGKNSFSLLTSDLTKEYVHINSTYTS